MLLKFILMEYVFPLKKYLFLPLARHHGIIIISSWKKKKKVVAIFLPFLRS